ncbi:acyltransferase [Ralstonia solanacearum]|uniref:acyltransferase n=1 Tax=Ralstonia solanacearum TaxID=305 RepID=UPI000696FF1F|nr:acyltransferase [Ralstonia solanacearum]MDB0542251.1 acyltransferase [Ralstonia solanacearum]MDB0552477.1 acyltransferase [Ralstonia solanacearum]MDB0557215.1 acyltransferase [Ralstonia solanacearum]
MTLRHHLGRLCGWLAVRHNIGTGWWRRLAPPTGAHWARYLQRHGRLYAMGTGCVIQSNVVFTDPAYVRLGNNVHLTGCTLFGHDGVVNMLEDAYGGLLDKVGGIDIRDNVFVGHQAIIMPGVRIGPDAVVAAGALVTADVPPGTIVGGIPARPIGTVAHLRDRLAAETDRLPWYSLLAARMPGDPPTNAALDAARTAHFFADRTGGARHVA